MLEHGLSAIMGDVLHSCDNPVCCNPAHLRVGTDKDNAADRIARNRQQRGSRVPTAKLDEVRVSAIKRDLRNGLTPQQIAPRERVSLGAIYSIKSGVNWKHVE
jgi:hypothetical protein